MIANMCCRHEERKTAMLQLIKLCRTDQSEEVWMEHFKNVLLLLLETLGDDDVSVISLISIDAWPV